MRRPSSAGTPWRRHAAAGHQVHRPRPAEHPDPPGCRPGPDDLTATSNPSLPPRKRRRPSTPDAPDERNCYEDAGIAHSEIASSAARITTNPCGRRRWLRGTAESAGRNHGATGRDVPGLSREITVGLVAPAAVSTPIIVAGSDAARGGRPSRHQPLVAVSFSGFRVCSSSIALIRVDWLHC